MLCFGLFSRNRAGANNPAPVDQKPVPQKFEPLPENFEKWMDEVMAGRLDHVLNGQYEKNEVAAFVDILENIAKTQAARLDYFDEIDFTSKYGLVKIKEVKVSEIDCLESSIGDKEFSTGQFAKIDRLQSFLKSEL